MKPSTIFFSDHEGQKQNKTKNQNQKKMLRSKQQKTQPNQEASNRVHVPHPGHTPAPREHWAGVPGSPGTEWPRLIARPCPGWQRSGDSTLHLRQWGSWRRTGLPWGACGGSVFYPVFLSQPPTPKAVWGSAAQSRPRPEQGSTVNETYLCGQLCQGGAGKPGGAGGFHPRGSLGPITLVS